MTEAMPQPNDHASDDATSPDERSPLTGAAILIGAADDASTAPTKASLRRRGVKEIAWRRTIAGFETALNEGRFDLAVIDLSLPGGDPIDLLRRIRLGQVGFDPFLPLIVTTWRAKNALISNALDAGADDVFAKPINAAKVATRMQRIAVARKPFVAANGYIGPVRARMSSVLQSAPKFEPPNSLKALAQGGGVMTPEGMAALEQAKRRLTAMRVNVCVQDLADAARGALGAEPPMSDADKRKTLSAAADGLEAIVAIVPAGNLKDELVRLANLGHFAADDGETANGERSAKLSVQIAEAISLTLSTRKEGSLDLPAQIVTSINNLLGDLHLDSKAPKPKKKK